MKTCSKCKQAYPIENFGRDLRRKDGHKYWCKECERSTAKARRASRDMTETYRRNNLKQKFSLTPEEYTAFLQRQNEVCAICEKPCPTGRRLAVDHDHVTGNIRGLLCTNCNVGLGRFHDDPNLLTKAMEYLDG